MITGERWICTMSHGTKVHFHRPNDQDPGWCCPREPWIKESFLQLDDEDDAEDVDESVETKASAV
jgi:hypothetical protein